MRPNRVKQVSQQGQNSESAKLRARSCFSLQLTALLTILFTSASAHDSLYQVMELNEDETGRRTVATFIHLPDLVTDFGIDSNATNLEWWPDLSRTEQKEILARADRLMKDRFHFEEESIREALAKIRLTPETAKSARPCCLVAAATFSAQTAELKLTYTSLGKRLMVVITKPGAFPKVLDLAPGEQLQIPLSATAP